VCRALRCAVGVMQVIRLRFTHMSLWDETDSAGACSDMADRLTVEEHGRKPVCVTATTATSTTVTKTNQATVRFVTNELGHALGFRAFYRAGRSVTSACLSLSVLCIEQYSTNSTVSVKLTFVAKMGGSEAILGGFQ